MTEKCEFKSAKDLGLTQKEWEALITTLTLLDNDAIVHAPSATNEELIAYEPRKVTHPIFNMSAWRNKYACGTAMCIGGSAEFFGKLKMNQLCSKAEEDSALTNLFYPYHVGDNWGRLTTKQAAHALRTYLMTGKDGWKEAVATK